MSGRRSILAPAFALAALVGCSGATPPSPDGPAARLKLGYTPATSAAQQALETRFRGAVSADTMSSMHLALTGRPHPAGSEGTTAVVAYLQQTLGGFGLDVAGTSTRCCWPHRAGSR